MKRNAAMKKNTTSGQHADLQHAVKVLRTEADGLLALADHLNGDFTDSIDAIDRMKQARQGRLIVAGIGKSGHVAKKITATLASTGTPSYFVHPGEASHGDLGMITEQDIVLMLSNSGENNELSDLIAYTRRFGIMLIAMTSNPDSTLARHADKALLLPKMPEACPNGLAPTTSTTMMMALGDALAIALLERMGLTAEQFRVFHPGGKLGQKLIGVSDLMHRNEDMPFVTEQTMMDEALLTMTEKNLGCVVVVDKNKKLQGIITDGDLKRHMGPDLLQMKVADVMTRNPKTVPAGALAAEAMATMTKTPGRYLTSLIVVDDKDDVTGLIQLQDCLKAGIA